jgi:hypothetical protein
MALSADRAWAHVEMGWARKRGMILIVADKNNFCVIFFNIEQCTA